MPVTGEENVAVAKQVFWEISRVLSKHGIHIGMNGNDSVRMMPVVIDQALTSVDSFRAETEKAIRERDAALADQKLLQTELAELKAVNEQRWQRIRGLFL